MDCPKSFEYMTPDSVAECVDGITPQTYRELWQTVSKVNAPQGGDGSNGTVEEPVIADYMVQAWPHLSDAAKQNIIDCAAKEEEQHVRG